MSDDFTKFATKTDIAEGTAKVFTVDGVRIAVCNVAGKCYAIEDVCTHDNAPLGAGELVDDQIECPRHGARFDVTNGKAMCLPAVKPVKTFAVEEKDGELFVDTKAAATN
ncbi:MAG: non-heme iron oxygenase ferredoxin subunit [Candidatus Obscuribacterales bacterium]|nr:non-heme iron oxygenase ferredoxin subunit [Candidatus Obscuribacterales bacterium]